MQIISLSLAHLGLGLLIISALVGVREVGRGFFTLCGWSGVALTGAAWGLTGSSVGLEMFPAFSSIPGLLGFGALVVFAAGWILLRARRRGLAAPFHHTAGLLAAAAVAVEGWLLATATLSGSVLPVSGGGLSPVAGVHHPAGLIETLTAADFLLSAGLLGGATVAMVLGHWYLVQIGLSIVPLRRLAWCFMVVLGLRTILEVAAAAGAISGGGISLAAPPGEVLPFPALILAQRALFGLIAPVILAPLVYRTVTMRATMSATGLLYVAVALVWVGEFLSKYLMMPLRLI